MKEAWEYGNVDVAALMVVQSIGLINDIPTCKELLKRMTEEAEDKIKEISARLK